MITTILPKAQRAFWIASRAGAIEYNGVTHVGELTGVNADYQVVHAEGETEFVAALPAADLPTLPDSGWLEIGEVYQYKGTALMVRQSHNRTHYEPEDTPALFVVHREDAADVLEWIAGEKVDIGTLRTYGGVTYRCIREHVTQSDWTPPKVPDLWQPHVDDSDEPQPWVQPEGSHDAYKLGVKVTHKGYVWENIVDNNVWEPGVYGWKVV